MSVDPPIQCLINRSKDFKRKTWAAQLRFVEDTVQELEDLRELLETLLKSGELCAKDDAAVRDALGYKEKV